MLSLWKEHKNVRSLWTTSTKHGVTPYKVAKEAGVTQTALSNWKSGRSTPSSKTLQKIADYFGITVDYLMTGKDNPKEKAPELTD